MSVIPVDSWDDPRLEAYRQLKDRELARQGERFIAEGWFIVQRLLASDFPVESILAARSKLAELLPLVRADTPVYVLEDREIDRVIGYKFHLGTLACARRKPSPTLEDVLGPPDGGQAITPQPRTLVIGPEIINHDNLGALIRICAGMGADALLLGQRSCDPFWRRSVRVSMGTVFRLPIVRSADILHDLHRLKTDWGVQLLAAVLDDAAQPLRQVSRPPPPHRLGILVGNEAQGLPASFVRLCDRKVMIPMHLGTDSLNVAVATAVFLYHFGGSPG